jgi:3-methyladenine DNA glycosylase/8-oxoguanine DNA glycosylase
LQVDSSTPLTWDHEAVPEKLRLAGDPEADKPLVEDPFTLLMGIILDQQMSIEVAFAGPRKIVGRAGRCATELAIHRYRG